MIQITPQMRLLLAVEPADFRKGIDGLVSLCRQRLEAEPLEGALFVFRNRRAKSLKMICYDGYVNIEIMGRRNWQTSYFRRKSESDKGWCSHNLKRLQKGQNVRSCSFGNPFASNRCFQLIKSLPLHVNISLQVCVSRG